MVSCFPYGNLILNSQKGSITKLAKEHTWAPSKTTGQDLPSEMSIAHYLRTYESCKQLENRDRKLFKNTVPKTAQCAVSFAQVSFHVFLKKTPCIL